MSKPGIHLLMPEPWMWYESITYTKSYLTPMHRHSTWQLTASLCGEFLFGVPGKMIVLKPGEWILMSPEFLHSAGSDTPPASAMQIFFRRFPHDLLPEFAGGFNLKRGVCRTGHIDVKYQERISDAFLEKAGDSEPYGKSWRSVLGMEFVVSCLSALSLEPDETENVHPEIVRVLEFMEEHFAEPLGVAEFAEAVGLSESRFSTVFKQETGSSPMHFFNTVRLGRAQSFLLNGASIDEAAQQSGFSSSQYFCRYFKKRTGVSPSAFRARPFVH